jgi:hypothetical protein
MTSTEPNVAFFWEACRRQPRPDAVSRSLDSGLETSTLLEAARRNRMAPLLWRSLVLAGRQDQLGEVGRELGDLAAVANIRALVVVPAALSHALEPLTASGLEPVVLKGPAVATHYPDAGLRPMDDIDLLLPAAQHQTALRLLTDSGWEVRRPASRQRYDTVLTHPAVPGLPLELHYGLDASYERYSRLDSHGLWMRREPARLGDRAAYVLPPEEELVMLCQHAAKPFHMFSRLIWVVDIAMLLDPQSEPARPVDWERVDELATTAECGTALAVGLTLAERVGAESPESLRALPESKWRRVQVEPLLQPSWPLQPRAAAAFGPRFAVTDSPWLRARLVLGAAHGETPGRKVRWLFSAPVRAVARWFGARRSTATGRTQPTGSGTSPRTSRRGP